MRPLKVLIVEDNPGDALIITEVLQDAGVPVQVRVVVDGGQALDVLRKEWGRGGRAADLIILDLNLPKIHGFDVLKIIKADDHLRSIPVVVMTGSLRDEDEETARRLGAADYFIKPATASEMEMSAISLRGQLKLLQRRGDWNPDRTDPSADASLAIFLGGEYHQALLPGSEWAINDLLEHGPWDLRG